MENCLLCLDVRMQVRTYFGAHFAANCEGCCIIDLSPYKLTCCMSPVCTMYTCASVCCSGRVRMRSLSLLRPVLPPSTLLAAVSSVNSFLRFYSHTLHVYAFLSLLILPPISLRSTLRTCLFLQSFGLLILPPISLHFLSSIKHACLFPAASSLARHHSPHSDVTDHVSCFFPIFVYFRVV